MDKPTMIKYIKDQPRALVNVFKRREEFTLPFAKIFQNHPIKKIYIFGSGTSYHASLVIRQYLEKFLKVEATASIPTIFTNYETPNNNGVYKKDEILCIAISQSGTSASTINAVKKARSEGFITVALTEDLNSLITKEAEYVIQLLCGKEEIPIETRGYTVTLLTGLLWAIEASYGTNNISDEVYQEYISSIRGNLLMMESVIEESIEWYKRNKEELLSMTIGAVAGYGINYPTTLESNLKLYETFHRPISAYEIEELMHGPEMAYSNKNYIFFIASEDKELEKFPLFVDFFKGLTSHIFTITCEDIQTEDKDLKLSINPIRELSPIVYIIPFQVFAALACEDIGYDTSIYPLKLRSFSHIR